LKQAQIALKAKYMELKRTWERSVFVEELSLTQESLRNVMRTLTSEQVRQSAEDFINSLDRLGNGFTG